MSDTKYIYVSTLNYDAGVYLTQIVDWLKLYRQHGLDFELMQLFSIGYLRQGDYCTTQKKLISEAIGANVSFYYILPPIGKIAQRINNWLFYRRLKKRIGNNGKVVVFSRAEIGEEIQFLKKQMPGKVYFYYDLRGATVAEKMNNIKVKNTYSKNEYNTVARIAYSEYLRQQVADKIFVVSKALKQYFIDHYNSNADKFVLYPCLSSNKKFYYDETVREIIRKELNYSSDDHVFVYSGGVSNLYHVPDAFLQMFKKFKEIDEHAKLLLLIKKGNDALSKLIESDVLLKNNVVVIESVPNHDVVKYLNAADYGFLLRENITLNNVAFPSKFAEYMLCGLPTIITESLYDCSDYCIEHHSGYVISNEMYENITDTNFSGLFDISFDRNRIAEEAKDNLSKESQIDRIVSEIKQ